MKIAHVLSEERRHRRALRILLIGCGGNGSAVLFGLPYLHHALIAWGNPWGIDVTVMAADTVSPTNCVRQPFGAADVGQNKATILVNRINMFHGLIWRSEEALFSGERRNVFSGYDTALDIVISCVDTRGARREIHEGLNNKTGPWRQIRYWLDVGNNANNGQFVLGQPLNDINRASRTRLRTVTELFPSIMDTTQGEGNTPQLFSRRGPRASGALHQQRARIECPGNAHETASLWHSRSSRSFLQRRHRAFCSDAY